jgi:hypothetical protein
MWLAQGFITYWDYSKSNCVDVIDFVILICAYLRYAASIPQVELGGVRSVMFNLEWKGPLTAWQIFEPLCCPSHGPRDPLLTTLANTSLFRT